MNQTTDQPVVHYQPIIVPPQPPRTNGLAVASFVLGLLWIWWLGSLLGIVFGAVALHQIDQAKGAQSGRGLAIAGMVLGWVGALSFIGFMVIGFALSSSPGY